MEDRLKPASPILIRVKDSEIRFSSTFVIGRDPDCDLQMADHRVSRKHVTIEFDGASWTIRDMGSVNGTYVNGVRIKEERLRGDSEIQLGGRGPVLSVFVQDEDSPSQAAPQTTPTAFSSETQIMQHYFTKGKTGETGDRTRMFMRAFERAHKERSRKYVVAIGVALCLLIASGSIILYQKNKINKLRSTAENIFYSMKSMELQIAKMEEVALSRADQAQLNELAEKRAKLKEMGKDYEIFVKDLGIYKGLSEEDRIIFRMARLFGECDIIIPRSFLKEVTNYINKWKSTDRLRSALLRAKSKGYSAAIEKVMSRNNLPPHYFFLALQESGFNDRAVGLHTRYGYAKGVWQFIAVTAHKYGLEPGPLYETASYDPLDDRFNFEKATAAAGKYLKDLNDTEAQASGLLVMASYNWGENNVIPIIEKMPENPRERNFWHLLASKNIPRETYDYVLYIFSASVICENPGLFGFENIECPAFNAR
jgi:soluble lytic murein transglycosylase-like protein